jgi:hypothetical protein
VATRKPSVSMGERKDIPADIVRGARTESPA